MSKVRVTDGVIITHKIPHILRMVRRTKFKLGTQVNDDDLRYAHATCPPRSKPKVTRSRDQCDTCRSISGERKAMETPKLVGKFPTTSAILRTSFKVKRSKMRLTDGVILTQNASYVANGKAYENQLRTQMDYKAPPHQAPP